RELTTVMKSGLKPDAKEMQMGAALWPYMLNKMQFYMPLKTALM
ncbi:unnamed protein product, partial [marine sediment metagenome]